MPGWVRVKVLKSLNPVADARRDRERERERESERERERQRERERAVQTLEPDITKSYTLHAPVTESPSKPHPLLA